MGVRLVFSRSTSLLSKIIRLFDRGKWSHVAIMLNDNFILDSRFPRGVQIREFDLEEYEIIEVEGSIDRALKFVGKANYDLSLFIWLGLKWGDKPWNNPNNMICSELISEAVHDENLKGMTPNQQYTYLKNKRPILSQSKN